MLWLDFETRSRCDLTVYGVYNYAQDPSTEVLCMSYAFDDEEVRTWTPDQPFPATVEFYKGQIRAHNAAFERLILWYVCGTAHKLEQFYCTAAQARANCLPGALEDVGRAVSSQMKKDHRGSQLIRQLSIPRADGSFNEDPKLMREMVDYCEQDVRTMRAVSKAMRDLSILELADYHANERINDRGVLIDRELVRAARRFANVEMNEIQDTVREVTNGELTSVRSPKMRQWVYDRVGPRARQLMQKDGKTSIDKSVRAGLLALDDPEEIPPDVMDVIQCADDIWASSVAKYQRLDNLADVEDHRVRGAFVFNGGSATGRASSYGAQVHNFTRKCAKEPEAVRQAMVRGHEIVPKYGKRVTDVLKGMLRPSLIPEKGKVFVVADWSAIEARCNPWLANDPLTQSLLGVFADGGDIYIREAAGIFRKEESEVTPDERQIGKVAILSCFGHDTQVLTNNGYKAIVDVKLTDKLWDGVEWVTHQGVLQKGLRETIRAFGVSVTEDHLIKVKQDWVAAKTVLSCSSTLTQALATGSANLPFSAHLSLKKALVSKEWLACSVRAARNHTQYIYTIFSKALLHAVTRALKKLPVSGARTFTGMPTYALTTNTDADCSGAYPRASTDAITQKIEGFHTTAQEASTFTSRGAKNDVSFLNMLCLLMGGMFRNLSWIGSMSTKVMSRATFGLLRAKKTWPTNDLSQTCKTESLSLKPVFDILNSGPRNRFTIKTDVGHLIVHNCGYGGGVGAFNNMARAYGISLTEKETKKTIDAWRRSNIWAVNYWGALESAYMRAIRNPKREFSAGRVTYMHDGTHLWYSLPSKRILCYPFAKIENDEVTYVKASWKPAADAKEWPRARLWRGLAAENICQATANDLLRHALRQLDDVVLHVHDEIVGEVDQADAEAYAQKLKEIMCTPPDWAAGLPLNADVKIMERYGK